MDSDLYKKIVGERGSLETLMSKIPGIKGYAEMSSRREADRQLREHVASKYETLINRFASVEGDLVRGGGLLHMDKTKNIKTKIENLRRRIASDTPGYTGFFASNKIGPEDLQRVYAFDNAMLDYADTIGAKIDAVGSAVAANEGLAQALTELDIAVNEAGEAYDLRDGVLNGLE